VLTEHGIQIAPRTFYAWAVRAPSKRSLWDATITEVLVTGSSNGGMLTNAGRTLTNAGSKCPDLFRVHSAPCEFTEQGFDRTGDA